MTEGFSRLWWYDVIEATDLFHYVPPLYHLLHYVPPREKKCLWLIYIYLLLANLS